MEHPSLDIENLLGREIDGRYRLTGKIGEGGMGVVFQATQLSTQREVALKVVKVAGDDAQGTRVRRFRQEIDIISGLSHPNVVRVFDTGTIEELDLLYVVMEYVDGLSLHELMWRPDPQSHGYIKVRLRTELALEVVYQICGALTEPHRRDIVHRDLKPENILLAPSFDETIQVKVLDFGIALILNKDPSGGSPTASGRMTAERIPFVGTPHYIAPEQAVRTQYDARTDLYAIGVLLYEMLSGATPFDNDNLMAMLVKKTQEDAPPLQHAVPGAYPYPQVAALTARLLARDVAARPASALEVRRTIEQVRDHCRLERVRLDASRYLDDPDQARAADRAATLRGLFRPWLMDLTGEPLIPRNDDTWGEIGLEPPVSEVHEDISLEQAIQTSWPEPPRHQLRAWNVDAAWTDSLSSDQLPQDLGQMASWLEEDSTPSTNFEEVATAIWSPNEAYMQDLGRAFDQRHGHAPHTPSSLPSPKFEIQPVATRPAPPQPPALSMDTEPMDTSPAQALEPDTLEVAPLGQAPQFGTQPAPAKAAPRPTPPRTAAPLHDDTAQIRRAGAASFASPQASPARSKPLVLVAVLLLLGIGAIAFILASLI